MGAYVHGFGSIGRKEYP